MQPLQKLGGKVSFSSKKYVFLSSAGFRPLTRDLLLIFQEPEDEVFLAIAKAVEEMVEDSVDCYWIIRCFVNQLNNKYRESLPQLVRDAFLSLEGSGGQWY